VPDPHRGHGKKHEVCRQGDDDADEFKE